MDPQQPINNGQPSTPQAPLTPTEPPKSKKTLLIIIAIALVVVVLGVIIFAMLNSNKNDTNTSSNSQPPSTSQSTNQDSDKYQKYNVTDKVNGATFSVSFYKDAKVEEKNGRTYLNSGETGSMYSIYLGTATGDKIDCGSTPSTTMKLGGESTTVCYAADNKQYAGYAKAKNGAVKINLAGQIPISMDDAKAIMESVTFN